MVLPDSFGVSYPSPKLMRFTLVLRERFAIEPVSTGSMSGCIYEHRLISMILFFPDNHRLSWSILYAA